MNKDDAVDHFAKKDLVRKDLMEKYDELNDLILSIEGQTRTCYRTCDGKECNRCCDGCCGHCCDGCCDNCYAACCDNCDGFCCDDCVDDCKNTSIAIKSPAKKRKIEKLKEQRSSLRALLMSL